MTFTDSFWSRSKRGNPFSQNGAYRQFFMRFSIVEQTAKSDEGTKILDYIFDD